MIPPAKGMAAFSSSFNGCSKARSRTLDSASDHVPRDGIWSEEGRSFPALVGKAMVDARLAVYKVRTGKGDEYWDATQIASPPRAIFGQELVVSGNQVLQLTTAEASRFDICQRDCLCL